MALLQISEPDDISVKNKCVSIGIDFGTTNSLVAIVRNNIPEVLKDKYGYFLIPSIVRYLPDGKIYVGKKAKITQNIDPKNTISSIKRFIARDLKNININSFPYDFQNKFGMLHIKTISGIKSPIEISAQIFITLKKIAENAVNNRIFGAVITVPAYFNDIQRQFTKNAAKLAGLNVLRLLNEPTSAAIAYKLDKNIFEGIFAVYDLGGGTFDISILKFKNGVFKVLSVGGDSNLGGDDFDYCLFSWIVKNAFLKKLSYKDVNILMIKSREIKELLSYQSSVKLNVKLSDKKIVNITIDMKQFFTITQHLVNRTILLSSKALMDANLTIKDINNVILVGGSTRMKHIHEGVSNFFRTTLLTSIDPDKAVVFGAAIQANFLSGNRGIDDNFLLLDVIPLSLGIETIGGLVEKIIFRNTTIPCSYSGEFTTFKDNQTAIAIKVVQGEDELVKNCQVLANFELRDIPPMPAGRARIKVTYQVDADGLLSIFAYEKISGKKKFITIKPFYNMNLDEIKSNLKDK
ncbi:Fe-S protein assembly chaperone HscA [Candidatus Profftella armatura]|uniref:Fe-S protein assembly chaperone HscA n=1 Tax=Candidatus Profftella armatura TaxID=669502 RepID=UPI003D96CEF9